MRSKYALFILKIVHAIAQPNDYVICRCDVGWFATVQNMAEKLRSVRVDIVSLKRQISKAARTPAIRVNKLTSQLAKLGSGL